MLTADKNFAERCKVSFVRFICVALLMPVEKKITLDSPTLRRVTQIQLPREEIAQMTVPDTPAPLTMGHLLQETVWEAIILEFDPKHSR